MLMFSRPISRLFVAAGLTLLVAAPARAQATVDPSGHWEGAIDAQGNELRFELDLMRGDAGHLVGTLNVPSQHLKGIRLQRSPSMVGPSVSTPVGISRSEDRCPPTADRSAASTR